MALKLLTLVQNVVCKIIVIGKRVGVIINLIIKYMEYASCL